MKSKSATRLLYFSIGLLYTSTWLHGKAVGVDSEPTPAEVRVTVVHADGSTKEVRDRIPSRQLLGEYWQGDGKGFNLYLSLKAGGRFECKWTGCLGVYGTSSGRWVIQEAGLKLSAEKAAGKLSDRPVDELRILSFQQHYLLLQTSDSDWFEKYGASTYCCFHQENVWDELKRHELNCIKRFARERKRMSQK